jgi:ubiquinone/menaquinone biosynthesis C-methylase UbiE
MLADLDNSNVIGIDINETELTQASTVFSKKSNLNFQFADVMKGDMDGQRFDIIVFAASVHYFPSLTTIVEKAKTLLNENGEIHIIDSHFYTDNTVAAAKRRSAEYFSDAGHPALISAYFHHSINEIKNLSASVLYDPASLSNKFLKRHPFHWIRFSKND